MRPLSLHIGPYGDVLRTSGRLGTFSGRPRDVILPSGINLQSQLYWSRGTPFFQAGDSFRNKIFRRRDPLLWTPVVLENLGL